MELVRTHRNNANRHNSAVKEIRGPRIIISCISPAYHLSLTPQYPRQSKDCPSFGFHNVLVTMFVSLNHAKGRGLTFHSKKFLIQPERHGNTLFWMDKNCEEMENIGIQNCEILEYITKIICEILEICDGKCDI